jgi:uncharacterized protein YlbG (UPF0298 family)
MDIARKLLVVYYHNKNCLKKISNFGNLIYHSTKLNYAYIYVDEKSVSNAIEGIKKVHGVNKVEQSLIEMSEYNFKL